MKNPWDGLLAWVQFAGCLLVVVMLYWAQAVLVPLAIAVLLTFLLAPVVNRLQRFVGPMPAMIAVVLSAGVLLALVGWGVTRQLSAFAEDLPGYRDNIREKITDIRGAGRGGSVEKVQQTLEEIQAEIAGPDAALGALPQPIVVTPQQVATLWNLPGWVGPLLEPLATAGLVIVLVIFMLAERQQLRDRLIGVLGHGHLAVTTKALDEAATRVSRYLLMQSLINLVFGIGVAIGLYFIGVPHPFLWALLAAVLRFIPYVGPWIGAGAPILVSLAALPGWTQPLLVIALFVCLELFTNLVLETLLYAGAAGVSPLALLVAVAFWTWLWGPLGLLVATPLTVCLVVLGKHVPRLEFMATLMADTPALAPDVSYYQRLLARDQSEAADLIERYVRTHPPETVYDALVVPALNYAERDRLEERLSAEEEAGVVEASRELIGDAATLVRAARVSIETNAGEALEELPQPVEPVAMLGYAAGSAADELALEVLRQLLEDLRITVDTPPAKMLASQIVDLVRERGYRLVCFVDLPPSAPSKTRYLVKKLRAALPEVRIVIGRWAPPALADDSPKPLLDAGANHVSVSLLDTCEYLRGILGRVPRTGPERADVQAA